MIRAAIYELILGSSYHLVFYLNVSPSCSYINIFAFQEVTLTLTSINPKEASVLVSGERRREIRHHLMMIRRKRKREALDSDLAVKPLM